MKQIKDKTETFEVETVLKRNGSKKVYKHIENGKKREQLVSQALKGIITQEEMRERAKKAKYFYSEAEYQKYINSK